MDRYGCGDLFAIEWSLTDENVTKSVMVGGKRMVFGVLMEPTQFGRFRFYFGDTFVTDNTHEVLIKSMGVLFDYGPLTKPFKDGPIKRTFMNARLCYEQFVHCICTYRCICCTQENTRQCKAHHRTECQFHPVSHYDADSEDDNYCHSEAEFDVSDWPSTENKTGLFIRTICTGLIEMLDDEIERLDSQFS